MFENATSFMKILVVAFIVLLSLLVFTLLSAAVSYFIFHVNIFSDASNLTLDAKNANLLKVLQMLYSVGLFAVPFFVVSFLFKWNAVNDFGLHISPQIQSIVMSLLVLLFGLPILNFATEINLQLHFPDYLSFVEDWMKRTEIENEKLMLLFLNVKTYNGLIFNVVLIALIPAFAEEFFFRGIVQRIFQEWTKNMHAGIFIASILFSAIHFQFYGFFPRFLLGIFLGYLMFWSRTIWLPIVLHFFNNAFGVIVYFIFGNESINNHLDKIGAEKGTYYTLVISIVLVMILILGIFRKEKRILHT